MLGGACTGTASLQRMGFGASGCQLPACPQAFLDPVLATRGPKAADRFQSSDLCYLRTFMCLCECACIALYTSMHVYGCMHTHACKCVHTCMHTCNAVITCGHAQVSIHVSVHTHVHTCVSMYA